MLAALGNGSGAGKREAFGVGLPQADLPRMPSSEALRLEADVSALSCGVQYLAAIHRYAGALPT